MKHSPSYGTRSPFPVTEVIDLSQHDGDRRSAPKRTSSPTSASREGLPRRVVTSAVPRAVAITSTSESSMEIDFTPHYKTLTATGKSHFSSMIYLFIISVNLYSLSQYFSSIRAGISDALAEFIDNSLQAMDPFVDSSTSSTPSPVRGVTSSSSKAASAHVGNTSAPPITSLFIRSIAIKVFFDPTNYIVIADNGEGMNAKKLQEFATFALDQESRNTSGMSGADFISKFGVGAKQAGFFLGSQITIFTKKQDGKGVLEFTLDENRLEERSESGEAVSINLSIILHLTMSVFTGFYVHLTTDIICRS